MTDGDTGHAKVGACSERDRTSLPHRRREANDAKTPLHVTTRVLPQVWKLRSRRCYRELERAFFPGCDRFGGKIVHFSVEHNHVHMVCEAQDSRSLARCIRALAIRMARGLNRVMQREGRVFADRYHRRVLRTPTEIRNVLRYVYLNAKKQLAPLGHSFSSCWLDQCSSAMWFDGWREHPRPPLYGPAPIASPTGWLLTTGWRRLGLLSTEDAPKAS